MTEPTYDILGIGNAIVDVVAQAEDAFLSRHDMHKGAMQLIDAATADALYAAMPPGLESSGGSVANSCAVAAALGARVAYIGKVADDQLGEVFRHDITRGGRALPDRAAGRRRTHGALPDPGDSGRPAHDEHLPGRLRDAGAADVQSQLVAAAKVTYLEGYLFDPPAAQAAFYKAGGGGARRRAAGRAVAVGCVLRQPPPRGVPRRWWPGMWTSCSPTRPRSPACMRRTTSRRRPNWRAPMSALAVLTRSEDGSVILRGARP